MKNFIKKEIVILPETREVLFEKCNAKAKVLFILERELSICEIVKESKKFLIIKRIGEKTHTVAAIYYDNPYEKSKNEESKNEELKINEYLYKTIVRELGLKNSNDLLPYYVGNFFGYLG